MDFWARQQSAKKKTRLLVLLYACLLLLSCSLFAFAVYFLLAYEQSFDEIVFSSGFAITFGVFLCLIGLITAFAPASMSKGGKSVAESLGGRLVTPGSENLQDRRLLNVVEEMALASGLPVPPVYILQKERSINAFAAGRTVNDAVIGITRGALEELTRDELQAVVAHEFSHILNEDMRLNLRFARLLFGLMGLTVIGKVILANLHRVRTRGKDSGKALALIVAFGLVCYLGGLFTAWLGTLIQAAVNRQREHLADASAIQFTRSDALVTALEKIERQGGRTIKTETPYLKNYRHFFFCQPDWSLLSTHPRLSERVLQARANLQQLRQMEENNGLAGAQPETTTLPQTDDGANPKAAARRRLRSAAHNPLDACALVLAMLLDGNPDIREKQLAATGSLVTGESLIQYADDLALLEEDEGLTLLEMSVPALKTMSAGQFEIFGGVMRECILADGVCSFKEWLLYQLVESMVGAQYQPEPKALPARFRTAGKFGATNNAAIRVLAALACLEPDETKAGPAFAAGLPHLGLSDRPMPQNLTLAELSEAVNLLRRSDHAAKDRLLLAGVHTAAHDGIITMEEGQLLRMLQLCLGRALPPNLPLHGEMRTILNGLRKVDRA